MARFVPTFALALLLGCGGSPPVPPELEGLQLPARNAPAARPELGVQTQALTIRELPPAGPALRISRGGRAPEAEVQVAGALSADATRLAIQPSTGDALEIRYRLPTDLPAPRRTAATARARVLDVSSPDGADRLVQVHDDSGLTFGEVWRTAPSPLRIELEGGLRLDQEAIEPGEGAGYLSVPLAAIDAAGRRTPLAPDRVTTVALPTGPVAVHVSVSHYRVGDRMDGHGAGQYVLHAWLSGPATP